MELALAHHSLELANDLIKNVLADKNKNIFFKYV